MIQELVESCGGLSRMELARTVCELLDWKRPTGKLKARECREFLERLEGEGRLELPDKRPGKPVGTRTRIPQTERGEPSEPLEGELSEIQPVVLEVVRSDEQRLLFRELVDRHHYLGHASKLFPLGREPSTLLVAQAQPLTELRLQNTVLLLQILEDLLLLLVQPTGQERDQEDLWRDKCAHRKHRSGSHLRLRKMTG